MSRIEGRQVPLVKAEDFLEDPQKLRQLLTAKGVLDFRAYRCGLFPASDLPAGLSEATGMGRAWNRDNAHIGNALLASGEATAAGKVARAILDIYGGHFARHPIPPGLGEQDDARLRLPGRVRVDPIREDEDATRNLQNDAVGYALWFIGRCASAGVIGLGEEDLATLQKVVGYLGAIHYWEDADCGHWEEDRQVHNSSIGAAVAGLQTMQPWLTGKRRAGEVQELIEWGWRALEHTLPWETPGESGRRYDASLLFLVEPLHLLDSRQSETVVGDVLKKLVRDIGVIRYPGDSYWGPDFCQVLDIGERTSYAVGRLEQRNLQSQNIQVAKQEAQWTLFDALISVYWGRRRRESGSNEFRTMQLHYLNRSLGQLESSADGQRWQLPEAYFLEEGKWVANEHSPLLWSQANLLLALLAFEAQG